MTHRAIKIHPFPCDAQRHGYKSQPPTWGYVLGPLVAIGVVMLGLLILCGCFDHPQSSPPAPMQGAGNDNASLGTDIDAIIRAVTAAKPHCDAIGQALLDQVAATAADASKKSDETAKDLNQANADAAAQKKADADALAKQKADYEAKLAKAKADAEAADGHAFATHALYILAICGVPVFAFAVVLWWKSATTWGASLAVGSAVLSLSSIGLALTINVLERVSPVAVWCIGGLLIVATLGFAVFFVIEIVYRSKAIVAQHADSTGNKQPTVSYPPAVAKVLTKVLSPAIGSVAAEAAVDAVPVPVAVSVTTPASAANLQGIVKPV